MVASIDFLNVVLLTLFEVMLRQDGYYSQLLVEIVLLHVVAPDSRWLLGGEIKQRSREALGGKYVTVY